MEEKEFDADEYLDHLYSGITAIKTLKEEIGEEGMLKILEQASVRLEEKEF